MKKIRIKTGDVVFNIVNWTFFALFTLVCIYPFYYIFINTISSNEISTKGDVIFYPVGVHFENYVQVLKIPGLLAATAVSLLRTVLGTVLTMLGSAFLGFLFTKQKMFGRKFSYRFLLITMWFNAGLIPWYITMRTLGLTNNFLAYVIPAIVSPFFVILVKTYIESTPVALQEAAEIDGAGTFTIFSKIILPITRPILATIAIFSSVGQWNSFIDTLFLMTDQKLFTLQFILYRYLNEANSLATMIRSSQGAIDVNLALRQTAHSVQMTVTMIVVFPILLSYPFFQRYFVKGIMIGAIKG